MTSEAADSLVEQFEQGAISGGAFRHEDHVRVAWELTRRYDHEEGLERMSAGIRRMAHHAGDASKYHVTITRAWYELISGVDSLERHPELMDKRLLSRFYSAERLAAGRERWLEPDIQPLRLDP